MAHSTILERERSPAYGKYAAARDKIYMTMPEAVSLSEDLAAEIAAAGGVPDLVVGLANGALVPAKIVAGQLGVPFEIVQVRRIGSRYKQYLFRLKQMLGLPNWLVTLPVLMPLWRLLQTRHETLEVSQDGFGFDVTGRDVVIVDDAIHTGASLRYVRQRIQDAGARRIRTAVICWYQGEGDSGSWQPDIWLHRKDQYYPWSNVSPHYAEFEAWLRRNGLVLWQ
ncbi:phosphoribosyltransferase [Paracraurococcus ruber]|nr:phosphoribosyltransferase [Paracraurococcus ruber]